MPMAMAALDKLDQSTRTLETALARAKLLEELPDGVLVLDNFLHVVDANASARQFLGISVEAIGKLATDVIPQWSCLEHLLKSEPQHIEWKQNTESEPQWFHVDTVPLKDNQGHRSGFMLLMRNITEQKKTEEQLRYLATTDGLTGLWNRRHFTERCEQEIARAKRYGQPLGLIIGDIDHFKRVNDTLGHAVGDIALQHIASILTTTVRQVDIVGRIGGEEFAVLLPNTKIAETIQTAERLRKQIENNPLYHDGKQIDLTMSFGVTTSEDVSMLNEMLKLADDALYAAKAKGRNCTVYQPTKVKEEVGTMDREIAMRILMLVNTGLEALEYVNTHSLAGASEQTMTVFTDVVQAFVEIEQVLTASGMLDEVESSTQSLKDGFSWMVKGYEKPESVQPVDMMRLTVLPRYKAWQEELQMCFSKYTEC